MNKQREKELVKSDLRQLTIRPALRTDAHEISNLLDQIGYPGTGSFIENRIYELNNRVGEYLMVADYNDKILGFMSLHITPQLALPCDFARILYFVVDKEFRGLGIGTTMLAFAKKMAHEEGCTALELQYADHRTESYRFYTDKGFKESPKYFVKMLRNRDYESAY